MSVECGIDEKQVAAFVAAMDSVVVSAEQAARAMAVAMVAVGEAQRRRARKIHNELVWAQLGRRRRV